MKPYNKLYKAPVLQFKAAVFIPQNAMFKRYLFKKGMRGNYNTTQKLRKMGFITKLQLPNSDTPILEYFTISNVWNGDILTQLVKYNPEKNTIEIKGGTTYKATGFHLPVSYINLYDAKDGYYEKFPLLYVKYGKNIYEHNCYSNTTKWMLLEKKELLVNTNDIFCCRDGAFERTLQKYPHITNT